VTQPIQLLAAVVNLDSPGRYLRPTLTSSARLCTPSVPLQCHEQERARVPARPSRLSSDGASAT
jgi:hypothetical protein